MYKVKVTYRGRNNLFYTTVVMSSADRTSVITALSQEDAGDDGAEIDYSALSDMTYSVLGTY